MDLPFGREEIKKIIPHREPFLLIDEIIELISGEKCTAIKNVLPDDFYFQGHFPENPVMPGVLIIEALAQTGAVCVLSMPEYRGRTAYFGGIKKARFRRMVKPGDLLTLETEIIKIKGPAGMGHSRAYTKEGIACECELTFAIAK